MKNITIRLLTGIVYVGVISFAVMYCSYTFLALFLIITFLCLREFYSLINSHKGIKINPYLHGAGGTILFLTFFLYTSKITGEVIFSLYLLYVVATLVHELYLNQKEPITRLAYIFFGQCYIALPFSVLNFPSFTGAHVYQGIWVMALFLFLWANDTGAYLIGVRFGKHRLWERISPKKSWEGFFGGLVFTIVIAFIFAHFNQQIGWYHWVFLSIGVVVFGTYGDLIESLMKRTLNVKDSGHSLPGHGGFLDRFDSLLLAAYALLFYMQLII
jgi:phosphatidate cytidylyltransferase